MPKSFIHTIYDLPPASSLYNSRRRRKTLRNFVGVRKKGSGLLGAGRGAKRRLDDQGKTKNKVKRKGSDRRKLMHRIFRPFLSRKNTGEENTEEAASQCSTPKFSGAEIELSERKSLIDLEEVLKRSIGSSSNTDVDKAVPHIVNERATPSNEEKPDDYNDYDDYFINAKQSTGDGDSMSLGRSELEESRTRKRGQGIMDTSDRFLDVSINSRPPLKSLSMPDIQAVENDNDGGDADSTGFNVDVKNKIMPKKENVMLGRSETFHSPRAIHAAHLKKLGDGVLENFITEGRSLDTLWTKVGKTKRPLDESIILYLLENNANVNARDHYGATPLHYAAQRGNVVAVNDLLSDPNIDIEVSLDFVLMRYRFSCLCIVLCFHGKFPSFSIIYIP